MLRVEKINTFYGSSHILHDVSFEVHQGEVVVLLGRNGVGKTTTLKSIMGIQPPKSGRIIYKGEDITGNQPFHNVRKGLALIPEDRCIFPNLTVEENSTWAFSTRGNSLTLRPSSTWSTVTSLNSNKEPNRWGQPFRG